MAPNLRQWITVISDATYFSDQALAPARRLQRAGDWDAALRLVPDGVSGAVLRADILTDRHAWRLDPPHEAVEAAEAIAAERPVYTQYLLAQLEYWRRLFKADGEPLGPDPADVFAQIEGQVAPGWSVFWLGVSLENVRGDAVAAQAAYRRALPAALDAHDLLLESYIVRHQAYYLLEQDRDAGLALLRRSLDLRAACGARPHTAAAQAALAEALESGPESVLLRRLVAHTAEELGLTWLKAEPEAAAADSAS